MLVIAAEISVKPDQIDAFKDLISWQAESSVAEEPGCQQFDVCQAEWDPNQFLLYEVYSDADAFDAHMGGPAFISKTCLSKNMPAALVLAGPS